MPKKTFYEKYEDIPELDRPDYVLETKTGSPYTGKYVLQIEQNHPTVLKNNELLGTIKTTETEHQTALSTKEAEITRLSGELTTAKQAQTQGLPAGHVAIAASDLTLLNQYKELGDLAVVKTKVEEHGTLKEKDELQTQLNLYADVAKTHNFDVQAFTSLAQAQKLADKLEFREVDDGKGKGEKVKHYFVKGKDATGADISTVVPEFVKKDENFIPFLASLQPKDANGKRRIPDQGVGDLVGDKPVSESYLSSTYERPDKTEK